MIWKCLGSREEHILGTFIYVYNFCYLLQYIISVLTVECLLLYKLFRVNDDEKEHTNCVLEEYPKKVSKDMTSNLRIRATNAYLKAHGVHVNNVKHHSATFLTVDQYTSVSDSLLIL
jgi:hypothetical protein